MLFGNQSQGEDLEALQKQNDSLQAKITELESKIEIIQEENNSLKTEKLENERIEKIRNYGKSLNAEDIAEKAISENKSVEEAVLVIADSKIETNSNFSTSVESFGESSSGELGANVETSLEDEAIDTKEKAIKHIKKRDSVTGKEAVSVAFKEFPNLFNNKED